MAAKSRTPRQVAEASRTNDFLGAKFRDEALASELWYAERERKEREAKSELLQELRRHGSLRDVYLHPELIPPWIMYPEIRAGEIVVIYGPPDVLAKAAFALEHAAAEGPSSEFENQRTGSGRELTLGLQCRRQCDVVRVVLHTTWHRFVPSLCAYGPAADSGSLSRRLWWSDPAEAHLSPSDDGLEECTPLNRPEQQPDLILCDLSDVDDRMTRDYSQVESLLGRYRHRNPLDRPALVFFVNEDGLSRTWYKGVWNGCDKVLRAQAVSEQGPERQIELIVQPFCSLFDADEARSGGARSEPKVRSKYLSKVVELWQQNVRNPPVVANILNCSRQQVWRVQQMAKALGMIPKDETV